MITFAALFAKIPDALKAIAGPVLNIVLKTYTYKSTLGWLKSQGLDLTSPSNDFKDRYIDAIVEYETANVIHPDVFIDFLLEEETRKLFEKSFNKESIIHLGVVSNLETVLKQQIGVMMDDGLLNAENIDLHFELALFQKTFLKVINDNRSTADNEQFKLTQSVFDLVEKIEAQMQNGARFTDTGFEAEILKIIELFTNFQIVLNKIDGTTGRIEEKVDMVLCLLSPDDTKTEILERVVKSDSLAIKLKSLAEIVKNETIDQLDDSHIAYLLNVKNIKELYNIDEFKDLFTLENKQEIPSHKIDPDTIWMMLDRDNLITRFDNSLTQVEEGVKLNPFILIGNECHEPKLFFKRLPTEFKHKKVHVLIHKRAWEDDGSDSLIDDFHTILTSNLVANGISIKSKDAKDPKVLTYEITNFEEFKHFDLIVWPIYLFYDDSLDSIKEAIACFVRFWDDNLDKLLPVLILQHKTEVDNVEIKSITQLDVLACLKTKYKCYTFMKIVELHCNEWLKYWKSELELECCLPPAEGCTLKEFKLNSKLTYKFLNT